MTLSRDIHRAFTLPPHVVVQRASRRVVRMLRSRAARAADARRCTYAPDAPMLAAPLFAVAPDAALGPEDIDRARRLRAHEFSLLGSGPIIVAHGAHCRGVEGHAYPPGPAVAPDAAGAWLAGRVTRANLIESQRIWRLVSSSYVPIDWQLDFKSGYRFSERTWYRDVRYGHLPGVDVKVPWELARCQHLPELARVAVVSRDAELRERCAREIVDEILDFIAQNPPRYGVNWVCPMDVGIRAANWTIALDVLRAAGVPLDPAFEHVVARSLLEHGRHIVGNLEWSPELRSNHYLADITGLFFISAHLDPTPETDAWLAFALQELAKVAQEQFYADGGNFEGSTSYHLLSLDMVSWARALLIRLPQERLARLGSYDPASITAGPGLAPPPLDAEAVQQTLARCVASGTRFAAELRRPDGAMPQIGDNDSGRFASVSLEAFDGPRGADEPQPPALARSQGDLAAIEQFQQRIAAGGLHVRRYVFPGGSLRVGLKLACFPDSGVYVYRSSRLYLAIRCGAIGQNGSGGHDHCDQLGIELWIEGRPLVRDPGTYLYTPLPERRNEYRSARAHFVPRVPGKEPARLDLGLFVLPGARPGVCEHAGPEAFLGRHDGYGETVWRLIEVFDDAVVVTDASALELEDLHDHRPPRYSPAYGTLEADSE